MGIFLKIKPSPWDDSQRKCLQRTFFRGFSGSWDSNVWNWNRLEPLGKHVKLSRKRDLCYPNPLETLDTLAQNISAFSALSADFSPPKKTSFLTCSLGGECQLNLGPLSTEAVKTTVKVSCFKRLRLVILKFSHELPTSPHASYVRPKHRHPRC